MIVELLTSTKYVNLRARLSVMCSIHLPVRRPLDVYPELEESL
jgi:hypothetical protein